MQSDLLKAIELDPSYADAYGLLGIGVFSARQESEAEQQAEKSVQLDPRSERLLLNLASLQLRAEDWDKAAATLERLKDSTNPRHS